MNAEGWTSLLEEGLTYIPIDAVENASDLIKGCDGAAVKPSVLVIEDETLISLDLCDTLVSAGYNVLGPATTVSGALFLLQQKQTPHLAIVDVLLRDGPCTEIARQLRDRKVPFFTYSGYGRHVTSMDGFGGAPWLSKPAPPSDIMRLLGELSVSRRAQA